MTDQTSAAQQPAVQATPTLTAAEILLAIKENFVVLSAAACVFGITVATTFLEPTSGSLIGGFCGTSNTQTFLLSASSRSASCRGHWLRCRELHIRS